MEFTYEEECYMAKNKAGEDLLHFLEWNYAMRCEELRAAQRLTRKETKQ